MVMPELPELEVIKAILNRETSGNKIENLVFIKPYILKGFFTGYEKTFPSRLKKIDRRGKFLVFHLENPMFLVIHLMKSGRIKIVRGSIKVSRFTSFCAQFSDTRRMEVVEYGKEKMAKVYIVKDTKAISGFINLGIEPFDPSFTEVSLKELLNDEKKKLKNFLKDQRKIAGIGNAYADEILWDAQLSPFKSSISLSDVEIKNLFSSIISVLKNAIKDVEKAAEGQIFKKEPRDFMKVYNKKGQPCPRCTRNIEWVYSKKNTIYYCPSCQTEGKIFKDRRLSKFLK